MSKRSVVEQWGGKACYVKEFGVPLPKPHENGEYVNSIECIGDWVTSLEQSTK